MRFAWPALLALALLLPGLRPATAEPEDLRIGWVVAGADLATLIFADLSVVQEAANWLEGETGR